MLPFLVFVLVTFNVQDVLKFKCKIPLPKVKDLYSSPNAVRVIMLRRMRWAGYVARMGGRRGIYRVLVGKPERKRPLGRPRLIWEDNIKMDFHEV
jgi:hypothetical protein